MRDRCCAVGCYAGHSGSSQKKPVRHPETRKLVQPEQLANLEDHLVPETGTPKCSFHRPASESQRIVWLKNAKLYEEGQDLILCTRHFLPETISRIDSKGIQLHPDAAPTLFPTHTIDADRPPKRKEPEPDDPAEDAQADKGDGTLLYWRSEENRPAKRPARPTDKQPSEKANENAVSADAVAAAQTLAQATVDGSVTVQSPEFPVNNKAAGARTKKKAGTSDAPMFLPMGVDNRNLPQVVIDRAFEAEYDVLAKQLATIGNRMMQLADHHRQAREHKKLLSYALNQIHCATATPQARRFTQETFEFANSLLHLMRAGSYEEFRKQNILLLPDYGAIKRWREKSYNKNKPPPPPLDEIQLLTPFTELPALTMPPAAATPEEADSNLQSLLQRIVAGDIVLEQ